MKQKKRKYVKRSPKWAGKMLRNVKRLAKAKPKLAKPGVFLFAFVPSGMSYFQINTHLKIHVGEQLTLEPQHDNAFDIFAIRVKYGSEQIGWFPVALGDPVRRLLHRMLPSLPIIGVVSSHRDRILQVSLHLAKTGLAKS